nr:MAG TPA_asm: hypothetical protein [Caudoviricetes sp.]
MDVKFPPRTFHLESSVPALLFFYFLFCVIAIKCLKKYQNYWVFNYIYYIL